MCAPEITVYVFAAAGVACLAAAQWLHVLVRRDLAETKRLFEEIDEALDRLCD